VNASIKSDTTNRHKLKRVSRVTLDPNKAVEFGVSKLIKTPKNVVKLTSDKLKRAERII
jgi:hypothetical protein